MLIMMSLDISHYCCCCCTKHVTVFIISFINYGFYGISVFYWIMIIIVLPSTTE